MIKDIIKIFGALIAVIFFASIISLVIHARPTNSLLPSNQATSSPQDAADSLKLRLLERGVPVKEVRMVSDSPGMVEILLHVSDETQKSHEDVWYRYLASREAEFAYLNLGIKLSGYRLTVENDKGEMISSTDTLLNSDNPSQKFNPSPFASIGDQEVKDLLMSKMNLADTKIIHFNVQTDDYLRQNAKYAEVELSIPENNASGRVSSFIATANQNIMELNRDKGAQIAALRLKIKDTQDNVIVYYVNDYEMQSEIWWLAENIEGGWYSKPIEGPAPSTPVPYPVPPSDSATQPLFP